MVPSLAARGSRRAGAAKLGNNRTRGHPGNCMKSDINFEDYLDAEVVDEGGQFIGSLLCYWIDEQGQAAFLGIKSSWEVNKTCVVPAAVADADERQSCI